MQIGTKNAATHTVPKHNITKIGAFLRRAKIDELPQVWNILRNDLSLVNPRPSLQSQTSLVGLRMESGVLKEKPGITGWAQIHKIDMSDPQKLTRKDAEYITLRTLSLDFKIILATALGKGAGDNTK